MHAEAVTKRWYTSCSPPFWKNWLVWLRDYQGVQDHVDYGIIQGNSQYDPHCGQFQSPPLLASGIRQN